MSSSAPLPASDKKPSPAINMLASAHANLDSFVAHLHRCLQTPGGIDTVLLLLCYTSRLSATVLDGLSQSALQSARRRAVAWLFALPPHTAVVVSAPVTAKALALSARLRNLSDLLSEARTFMRLWGLLGLYLALRNLVRKEWASFTGKGDYDEKTKAPATGGENLDRFVNWTRIMTGIGFQALENAAFLASKKVLALSPAQTMAAVRWSTRLWAVSTGVEIGRLLVEKMRKSRGDISTTEYKTWKAKWNRDILTNLAWAPLTVHWSLEKGFVNEPMIGVLATIPGIISMSQLWKDTAQKA